MAEAAIRYHIFLEVFTMKEKEIKVLKIVPGKVPEVVTLENNLHSLQVAVSEGARTSSLKTVDVSST